MRGTFAVLFLFPILFFQACTGSGGGPSGARTVTFSLQANPIFSSPTRLSAPASQGGVGFSGNWACGTDTGSFSSTVPTYTMEVPSTVPEGTLCVLTSINSITIQGLVYTLAGGTFGDGGTIYFAPPAAAGAAYPLALDQSVDGDVFTFVYRTVTYTTAGITITVQPPAAPVNAFTTILLGGSATAVTLNSGELDETGSGIHLSFVCNGHCPDSADGYTWSYAVGACPLPVDLASLDAFWAGATQVETTLDVADNSFVVDVPGDVNTTETCLLFRNPVGNYTVVTVGFMFNLLAGATYYSSLSGNDPESSAICLLEWLNKDNNTCTGNWDGLGRAVCQPDGVTLGWMYASDGTGAACAANTCCPGLTELMTNCDTHCKGKYGNAHPGTCQPNIGACSLPDGTTFDTAYCVCN